MLQLSDLQVYLKYFILEVNLPLTYFFEVL